MVFVAIPALLVAALYGALLVAQRGGRRAAIVLLGLLTPLAGLGAISGWVMAYNSGRCDEACYEEERGWAGTMDAWQWDAMFWAPLCGMIALFGAVFCVLQGRYRAALVRLSAAALAFVAYAVLWAPHTSEY